MNKVQYLLSLCEALDIPKARKEVIDMTDADIDTKSAYDWASRAIACFQLVLELEDPKEKLKKYEEGDDYRHEAYEHAALGVNPAELIQELIDEIGPHKDAAHEMIQGLL